MAIPAYMMTKEVEKKLRRLENRVVVLEREIENLRTRVGNIEGTRSPP